MNADAVGLERTAIPRLVRVLEAEGLLKINSVLSVKIVHSIAMKHL